ncbi:hypothetical protein BU26DRAFT_48189 [Trematosphaeria pertusa]|uniref:Uncharacterized protein n=1 Tax=Trematosphaeria pertusa TaxID=390896 RepID=A0A6A6I841_9PLEO|nr:uncharacterized protein BU26DRAFT_48189 [Trematosphaeria pertusa]KAF2246526.1 hypothetical protein BU26DRAFT_48189 [Trematosphaeria pertusa]
MSYTLRKVSPRTKTFRYAAESTKANREADSCVGGACLGQATRSISRGVGLSAHPRRNICKPCTHGPRQASKATSIGARMTSRGPMPVDLHGQGRCGPRSLSADARYLANRPLLLAAVGSAILIVVNLEVRRAHVASVEQCGGRVLASSGNVSDRRRRRAVYGRHQLPLLAGRPTPEAWH